MLRLWRDPNFQLRNTPHTRSAYINGGGECECVWYNPYNRSIPICVLDMWNNAHWASHDWMLIPTNSDARNLHNKYMWCDRGCPTYVFDGEREREKKIATTTPARCFSIEQTYMLRNEICLSLTRIISEYIIGSLHGNANSADRRVRSGDVEVGTLRR